MINLYNKDCMLALKEFKDNKFHLAIVDPPYGIGFDNKIRDKKKKNWDNEIPKDEYFKELQRVSRNQIIWGGNYFPYLWKKGCRGFIFWNKDVNFETYSAGELAYTSFIQPAKYYYYAWNGLADGIRGRNKKTKTIHPTQKPVKLYEWLLMNYASQGDKILDTHLGSGSIAIACHNLGFDLEGYELDKEYFEKAKKRLKEHQSQIRMF
tara:strand:+ start:1342 stop:1965 length:624 start_codon:yes stop_codon:yes gene_type:complete